MAGKELEVRVNGRLQRQQQPGSVALKKKESRISGTTKGEIVTLIPLLDTN